jgi:hypothetical protein
MNQPARPSPDNALRMVRRYFLSREDHVAVLAPWGKPSPVQTNGNLEALLAAHVGGSGAPEVKVVCHTACGQQDLRGHFRIGSYAPAPDGTTRWLCVDFDGGEDHADRLADPTSAAIAARAQFGEAGLPTYLEQSGGGHGWHLWCFFDPPVSAAKARRLAMALLPSEVTLASGEVVAIASGRGIEIFPKQDAISPDGFGNLVWLPWWSEAQGAANQFHRLDATGDLTPYAPAEFETVTEAQVDALLARLGPDRVEAERSLTGSPKDAGAPQDQAWREWRCQALAALPLESVFGKWLTGKTKARGWLECHDPWSGTGDRDPSAGVADGNGQAERGSFHSFISGRTLSLFDFLVERGDAADFRSACARVAEISGVPLPAPARDSASRVSPHGRPTIQVNNRQLRDIIAEAWSAVHAANRPPSLFGRSGTLARLQHEDGIVQVQTVGEDMVYGLLARCADWAKVSDLGATSVSPVRDVARDMLAYPDDQLPQLEAVVFAPVFDPAGRLVLNPGYHPQARLWYHRPPAFTLDVVPDSPTAEQVAGARSLLLDDLLVDFPFASEADRAHAVAALVLPFVRRMVNGSTPIHLIEAHTPGSGKGLLADLVSLIALGRCCKPTTLTTDEEEARKKITSMLARAQPLIVLDNIRAGISSAQLASAVTAEVWSDRMLGQNRMVDLPNRATWMMTANNPRLSLEIARRCARIRIDPPTDRPWERADFKHDPLREWVAANRGRLVFALLVLVQAWIAAGKPQGCRVLGSFESWTRVVGGILHHAGIDHFLGNTEELYETADAEGAEWREFVAAWWDAHRDNWVAAKDLLRLALERDLLGATIGDRSPRSQQTRLGRALAVVRDRQFGQWRVLLRHDTHSKSAGYRLIQTENCGTSGAICGTSCGTSDPYVPQPECDSYAGGLPVAGRCGTSTLPSRAHTHDTRARARIGGSLTSPAMSRKGHPTPPEASSDAGVSARDMGVGPGDTSRIMSRGCPADDAAEPVDLAQLDEDDGDD